MIKKTGEPSEAQLREKRMAENEAKIKALVEQVQRSKARQAELITQMQVERQAVEEKENSLAGPNSFSAVDLDIRNSQLMSSVQIERKRWLQAEEKQIFEILGQEEHLKAKFQQLQLEEKPLEKAKLIKLMKRKAELLQGLAKLKPDSGLYVSHQRVLLKQCLEDIRTINQELENSNKRFLNVEEEYMRAEARLLNTVSDLRQVISTEPSE